MASRAGPTVLVTTKSGSNQFHGSLFEFFRNTKLDAADLLRRVQTEKFNLNQFGGSLGGAIKKDKTFFFFDYQAKRQRHGIPFTGFVPTPAMMTGNFTAIHGGRVLGLRWHATMDGAEVILNTFRPVPVRGPGNPDT